jgi:hypothetical protein
VGKNKYIDLFNDMMPAIDLGIIELWDASDENGQKDIKGDLWNLNRYVSSVKGSRDKQELAVFKVNEYYNKNWAVLGSNHPKLQWQLLCISGNTGKKEFHPWIKLERKADSSSKAVQFLMKLYPNKKLDEVELIARISTKEEIKQLAKEHGYDKIDI